MGLCYSRTKLFQKQREIIEEVDREIPRLEKLGFDVITVTGDHSTPAVLKGHSWHPNPFGLAAKYLIPDEFETFNERTCKKGGLGQFLSVEAMPLMLGHARKLEKYGA